MTKLLINWLVSALVLLGVGYILPGVHIENLLAALAAVLVLGVINTFIKPFLLLLTLPINILTIGLFTLVVNALLIYLTTFIVPGFSVDNFWWAILLGIVLSVANSFIHSFSK